MLTAKIKHSMFSVASPNKLLFHTHLMSDSASVRTQLQNPAENIHFTVWLCQQLDPPQHLLLPHSQKKDKSGEITRAVRSRPGSGTPHFCIHPLAELGHLSTANYTEGWEISFCVFRQKNNLFWCTHAIDSVISSFYIFISMEHFPCCCRCCCWVASVVSDSVQPHRRQPTRLPRPWDSPGKNTGVGAISFSNAWKWKVKVKLLSRVQLLATPWAAAHQAPPSMGFSRQEY